ncbi:MAG TPA: ABC transporter permease, partial [Albitalea sp.]|nr:ABC transporter permease [Albitalea sp.]
ALVFIPVLGVFAVPEILGGKDDWLICNMIKESFLATRDWPFGSVLAIVLTIVVLAVAWLAGWLARRGARHV